MNTCGTCRYFGRKEDEWAYSTMRGYKTCALIDHGRKPKVAAYVMDASDYHATLCTSKEFGCNQWKAKP